MFHHIFTRAVCSFVPNYRFSTALQVYSIMTATRMNPRACWASVRFGSCSEVQGPDYDEEARKLFSILNLSTSGAASDESSRLHSRDLNEVTVTSVTISMSPLHHPHISSSLLHPGMLKATATWMPCGSTPPQEVKSSLGMPLPAARVRLKM